MLRCGTWTCSTTAKTVTPQSHTCTGRMDIAVRGCGISLHTRDVRGPQESRPSVIPFSCPKPWSQVDITTAYHAPACHINMLLPRTSACPTNAGARILPRGPRVVVSYSLRVPGYHISYHPKKLAIASPTWLVVSSQSFATRRALSLLRLSEHVYAIFTVEGFTFSRTFPLSTRCIFSCPWKAMSNWTRWHVDKTSGADSTSHNHVLKPNTSVYVKLHGAHAPHIASATVGHLRESHIPFISLSAAKVERFTQPVIALRSLMNFICVSSPSCAGS
ncbi:hypothetical protein ACJQWK_11211 [Exserohilum turcicum]